MAIRTYLFGNIAPGNRGTRILSSINMMIAMTRGACRRLGAPPLHRLPMNAVFIGYGYFRVTAAAGIRQVPLADPGGGIHHILGIMSSMAVAAVGRLQIARSQRCSMNAAFVPRHEERGKSYLFSYVRIIQVAVQAEFGLVLLIERRLLACWGNDGVRPVAIRAGWRFGDPFSQSQPVCGFLVLTECLRMALSAGFGDSDGIDAGFWILDAPNLMGAMTTLAGQGNGSALPH